jgi:predicted DCC family thiol-disulfide oxidoreductase YuxK
VILFDGVCNLCNAWVDFVIDRDPCGEFKFAPLQSAVGQKHLRAHGLVSSTPSAIVFVAGGRIYIGSSAILQICARLRGPWRYLALLSVIPLPVRELVYGWVARHRYRWFGRSGVCRVPTPDLKERFIEYAEDASEGREEVPLRIKCGDGLTEPRIHGKERPSACEAGGSPLLPS